ncbi:MAG: hypothetical protein ACHQRM_08270 [Bacteroidia bacterium]
MSKKCLECAESIIGRIDKKFCSDICRNSYNNKMNSVNNRYVRNVNSMLKRNRKILEELVPSESTKTTKAKLLQKGFNFHYYTNVFQSRKGDSYYFCYDYGYLPLDQDQYMLVKRNEKEQ